MGGLFSALTSSLAPFFLNPAVFIPGAALISAPIIIHLLNRLRFRKVRFAAMEFLLQSQKQNKRRVLFEQLLQLLPPVGRLVFTRIRHRPKDPVFPGAAQQRGA